SGFDGGTLLTFRLDFRTDGIGRLRLAMSTEPTRTLTAVVAGKPATEGSEPFAGEIEFQHGRELRAMLEAKLADANRPAALRWISRFDDSAKEALGAVEDHARKTPRPKLTEVYTTMNGGRDVFLLRRGDVGNKEGKAAPGFLQVLATTEPARWLAQPERDPRVALGDWMADS